MSILFISDVHADVKALKAMLALAGSDGFASHFGDVDTVFCLGDSMERGYFPRQTVELLQTIPDLKIVIGNHDEAVQRQEFIGSGDPQSMIAHSEFRKTPAMEYFEGMPKTIVDRKHAVYAAHGGILDPKVIAPFGTTKENLWLYTETWQRPTDNIAPYYDAFTGYYYTPAMSFDRAMEKLPWGHIIASGHQHQEHAYKMGKNKMVYNLMKTVIGKPVKVNGVKLRMKTFPLEEKTNYHFVVGAVTLTDHRNGWGKMCFGIQWENGSERCFSLVNCKPLLKV